MIGIEFICMYFFYRYRFKVFTCLNLSKKYYTNQIFCNDSSKSLDHFKHHSSNLESDFLTQIFGLAALKIPALRFGALNCALLWLCLVVVYPQKQFETWLWECLVLLSLRTSEIMYEHFHLIKSTENGKPKFCYCLWFFSCFGLFQFTL